MMTALSPTQVLQRRRQLLLDHDTEGFVDLFAADGVIELPFAGDGLPAKLSGQPAIREFSLRTEAAPMRIDDLREVAVHQTGDPEVVIVELDATVTLTSTGKRTAVRSIQVFRIRDGKIVLFRDYFNPNGLAELLQA
jgi:uncharacterized protein